MLTAAGCVPLSASAEENQTIETPAQEQINASKIQPFSIIIAAGESDGQWNSLANSIATQVTDQIPLMKAMVKSTSGVMENLKLVTSEKAGMTFGYDYHVILANEGKLASAFPNVKPEKLNIKCGVEITRPVFPDYPLHAQIVMALHEEPLHIVTTDATGIAALSDLKGKRISTGKANSGTEEQAGYVLKALGMDWEKDIAREQLGLTESVAALKDGRIDAFFWSGAEPTSEIIELNSASDVKIKFLPISGDDAEKIMRFNLNVFHKTKFSAGQHNGLETEVETLAVTVVLIAMQDFPVELIRQMVSMIMEDNRLTPELSISQLSAEARSYLHEGSVEYFKEQGVLK